MRFIYTVLFYLIQPFILIWLLFRCIGINDYRKRWTERYGFCKLTNKKGILIHCASVGEVFAATALIKKCLVNYPRLPVTVTTMTKTGSDQVTKLFGDRVSHVYLPYDLPGALNRFLKSLEPKLAIIMETELWPNFINCLSKKKIPIIIANARLSARSANRYTKLTSFIKQILNQITHIASQNREDASRFIALGANEKKISVTGNIKFDIDLDDTQLNQINALKSMLPSKRPIWIAASTHQGEDEIILKAHQLLLKKHQNLLLILVPRHPERFGYVENLIKTHQLIYQLRTNSNIINQNSAVFLLNTVGELSLFYSLADVAFIGGSLINKGGHNPLEAALYHIPIIMGQSYFNFKNICEELIKHKALYITESSSESIASNIDNFLTNIVLKQLSGEKAYNILKRNQGALDKLFNIIETELNELGDKKC